MSEQAKAIEAAIFTARERWASDMHGEVVRFGTDYNAYLAEAVVAALAEDPAPAGSAAAMREACAVVAHQAEDHYDSLGGEEYGEWIAKEIRALPLLPPDADAACPHDRWTHVVYGHGSFCADCGVLRSTITEARNP